MRDLVNRLTLLVVLTLPVGLFGAPLAEAARRSATVNCGLGDTIKSALATQRPGDTLTVTLTGGLPCVENVVIRNNDVTLKAAAAPSPIATISAQNEDQPTIAIDGAHRITLTRLFVRNGTPGVQATRGASVT